MPRILEKDTFEKKIMITITLPQKFSLRKAICSTLLICSICSFIFAQDFSNSAKSSSLSELKGFTQKYYYSPGQENRAEHIAKLMENAVLFFQEEIAFIPKTNMYILSPQDWKDYAAPPFHDVYGFPHNIDQTNLAIAAEDNSFWKSFLSKVDQLPPSVKVDIDKAYGKSDGSYSMMPFFDLLAIHEMGHSYTAQAGLKMQRHSMSELFVNMMLHTYIAEKNPKLLPALETFPNMVISEESQKFTFTSLEDFEKLYPILGMGPENYGWYQCQFHVAAKEIYNKGGKEVLIKLWTALKNHQQEMSQEMFIKMLQKEVHPAVADFYLNWNRRF